MRALLSFFLLLAAACCFAQTGVAPPPAIAAKSYLLLDFHSRQILATQKADERFEPASLTKLMTAYLTFSALKQKKIEPTQVVPV